MCSNLYSLVLLHDLFIPGSNNQHIKAPGHRTANADMDTHKHIHTHRNTGLSAITLHHSAVDDSVEKYPRGVLLSATLLCPAKNTKSIIRIHQAKLQCVLYSLLSETFSSPEMQSSSCPRPSFTLWTIDWNKNKYTCVILSLPIPLWCSAAAAAATAASRWALSSLAASWAPRTPDRVRRPDPPPSARPGWGSPDGCGPTGKPWACWERCWAWSCCCRDEE